MSTILIEIIIGKEEENREKMTEQILLRKWGDSFLDGKQKAAERLGGLIWSHGGRISKR